ncbi:ankyrin repeat domain-containing protein [Marichromatium bheemlicum]|uniref:Ankyrin repeat domain-containing protein n=1 Tax=Marichromatium bheemlicum TaxID=365339 RepID=A0ABX1I9M1_9GAMM|nr:ankyrin repeat domain-containing protein [Marichromatium bheemlicum]NKN33679.1 ankyrin repeat domain-containing protein [Marichromatium bheemlicum]
MTPARTLLLVTLLLVALTGCGGPDDQGAGDPALLEFAAQGDLGALDGLLSRTGQPDVRDNCDWTPLMKAALNGHTAVVERLLAAGATIDAEDKGGYTAMMLAASNNHADIVDLLLQHGAMIDHQEQTRGWTALIWATNQGRTAAVETLLQHGADRTLKDFEGKTAADWARINDKPEILALLQAG